MSDVAAATSASQPSQRFEHTTKYAGLAQTLLRHISESGMKRGERLGTEVDLAREYGVSRVTVRQALAMLEEDGYISRHKRRGTFVEKAVSPDAAPSTKHGTVALICSNEQADHAHEDLAFAVILRAMENRLSHLGFTVQIVSVGKDLAADRQRLHQLSHMVDLDGICTIGACLRNYYALLPSIPIVESCTFYPSMLPSVATDVREVARASVAYLLQHGHRRIAVLGGPWLDAQAFGLIATGTRDAYEAINETYPRELIAHAYADENLAEFAYQMLTGSDRPTAVFAEQWLICRAVFEAASRANLRIPKDLSVIAYGQNIQKLDLQLRVTAYIPPSQAVAECAIDVLTALIDAEDSDLPQLEDNGKVVPGDTVRSLSDSGKVQEAHHE